MTRTQHFVVGILTLVLTNASAPAFAQTTAPLVQRAEKKWSLVITGGTGGNEAARGIESAMREAGFDDETSGFLGGVIGYPFSSRSSSVSETDVTYRQNRWLAFGIRRSSVDLGSTHGHQDDFRYLRLSSKVTTYAPIAYLRVGPNLRVGGGPVAASTEVFSRPDAPVSGGTQSFKSTVYGGLLTVSLEGSILRHIAIGMNVSRVWLPKVAAGPFTSGSLNAAVGTATLPPLRVNMNHQTLGLSLGIRF